MKYRRYRCNNFLLSEIFVVAVVAVVAVVVAVQFSSRLLTGRHRDYTKGKSPCNKYTSGPELGE